jgi:WD40 repeat protein
MSLGLLLAGLLTAQDPAPHAGTPDALSKLQTQVAELLRREGVSPTTLETLRGMKQDVEALVRAREQAKATLPEDYRRDLEGHGALLRTLKVEALGKEDFNTLMDLAADLRAKAEYAKHGSDTRRVKVGKAPVYHLMLSANGKHLIAPDDFQLTSWDVENGKIVWRTPVSADNRVSGLATGSEGRLFAATSEGTISLLSADTGKILRRTRRPGPRVDWLAASPVGKFAVGREDGSLGLWSEADLTPLTLLWRDENSPPQASFSPDGKWLCIPSSTKGVTVLNVATEREEKTLPVEGGDVAIASFTPDGRRVSAVGRDGRITLFDWPEGKVVWRRENRQPLTWDAAVSPDGKYLATASGYRDQEGEVKLWDLTTGESFKTVRFASAVTTLSFSADSTSLATGHYDGSWRVWWNWIASITRNPFQPIPVQVRTFRGEQEVGGYEVFYVSIGHAKDAKVGTQLDGISSPAHGKIPAGRHYLWAKNGTSASARTLFTIDARSTDPFDLLVP